jgi:hypothetical protein
VIDLGRLPANRRLGGIARRRPNPEPQQVDVQFQITRRLCHGHAPHIRQPPFRA